MILNDRHIALFHDESQFAINPWDPAAIQPASYEIHIAETIHLSPANPPSDLYNLLFVNGSFQLSHTIETITLNPTAPLCAQLHGKSSLGRLGLLVHATAGFIDPGFTGQITLELKNLSDNDIILAEGQAVGQLVFHMLTEAPLIPYGDPRLGSHYQGQTGTTPSYLAKAATGI